jgi:NDP-sugar pyrophosphorylase family protein
MPAVIASPTRSTPQPASHLPNAASPSEPDPLSGVVGIVLAGAYHRADSMFLDSLPRSLAPVAQIPVIGYVLRWLRDAGIQRGTICANRGSRSLRSLVGDGSELSMYLDYVEDDTPRGPAGCARDAAQRHTADTFIVIDGSVIPDFDPRALVSAHRDSGAIVTAVVQSAVRDTAMGAQGLSPAGIYVFSRHAFSRVNPLGFQDVKEHLLPALRAANEQVLAYRSPRFCPRVLNAETYLAVNHWMIDRLADHAQVLEPWGAFSIVGEVASHATVKMHPTARIIGSAILGEGVTIGPGAVIVGPASLGPHTHVAENALVCRSVLWGGCQVGANAFVDASIVGNAVVIPAGRAINGEVVTTGQGAPIRPRSLKPTLPATADANSTVAGLAFR